MKMILALILFCMTCFSLQACDCESKLSEPLLWKMLYQGNSSLAHKLVLTRKTTTSNDEIMSQFMMAYLFYRSGQNQEIVPIFKGIDSYIEYNYKVNKNEITK